MSIICYDINIKIVGMSSQNDHPEPSQASDDVFLTRATLTDDIELQTMR